MTLLSGETDDWQDWLVDESLDQVLFLKRNMMIKRGIKKCNANFK